MLDENSLKSEFNGKKILVTGGTGSIGSEIVRRLLEQSSPDTIRVFSRDESKQFEMQHQYRNNPKLRFLIGDVRDLERLKMAMEDVDIVFHAAALKHVPSCEFNPFEAIKTNVYGTQNVIDAALYNHVKKVIFISTDKAVNPVNTMGATKLLAEKLAISANYYKGRKPTIFSAVRFGNVLASRGSVIPLFLGQIRNGGPVTLTDDKMTRFIMSTSNAVDLIFKATTIASGGEIFILKMPVVRIKDLLDVLLEEEKKKSKKAEPKVKIIGSRPGEKLYEELMTEDDARVSFETKDMFMIPPAGSSELVPSMFPQISEKLRAMGAKKCQLLKYDSSETQPISKEEIRKILREESLI